MGNEGRERVAEGIGVRLQMGRQWEQSGARRGRHL